MAEAPTRIGTPMHPHVYFRGDTPARITMRIHLAERDTWKGKLSRAVFINYAPTKAGWMVQFEAACGGYDFSCHVSLKLLLKADFESSCPLRLVEFAQHVQVSAEELMLEALSHSRGMQ